MEFGTYGIRPKLHYGIKFETHYAHTGCQADASDQKCFMELNQNTVCIKSKTFNAHTGCQGDT